MAANENRDSSMNASILAASISDDMGIMCRSMGFWKSTPTIACEAFPKENMK